MSFKVSKSPKFWTSVELNMLAEDGRKLNGRIKVQFTRFSQDDFQAFYARTKEEPVVKALLEVLHDWKGAEDDNGEVTFTPENFKAWCDAVPGSYGAISRRFIEVHTGKIFQEVREGN
jgi:hypothetical protein